jgi:deoxyribonuclease-4
MFGFAQHDSNRVQRAANGSLITVHRSPLLLGAHMSIAGGVQMSIQRACSIGCTAMQIFVKNNMQWFARPLIPEEIRGFLEHSQRHELLSIFAHANYLINLAATNPQFHANSLRALSEELIRTDQLKLPFLVLHPGAHLGEGEEAGLEKIVESIDFVLSGIPKLKTRIALETTAGQGSCLGSRFEQLAYIISRVREPERLCVCLDTAHIFAAGYNIGSESAVRKTFREFDRVIGPDRLVAIHLNDSKLLAARTSTGTNISVRARLVLRPSVSSCATGVSAKFPRSWKRRRARTSPRTCKI